MNRPLRLCVHAALGVALTGALMLGWTWRADRARRWETPSLREALVRLQAGQRVDPGRQATWMVAVNLRCPRCLVTLRRLDAAWTRCARTERLAALIVDTPRRPGLDALCELPPVPVWWDRDRIWRRRWGHRLYGEVLRFDADGRYAGTMSASEALQSVSMQAPARAPATHEGGSP